MAAKKSYYGLFIWLSLAALVVPVVVAVRAFDAAPRPFAKPTPVPDASGVDHALWDYLLKAYVEEGLVDYGGMERDYLFRTYLRQLGAARPDELATREERLALLCNAYNAFVINGVILHRVSDSVMSYDADGTGFFDLQEHIYAGRTVSLNHLEHEVIRPQYQEPRIHLALVCGALSCPAIRAEAYTGKDLERQLADQARLFANDPQHVRYDREAETLRLSAILKWYGEDFDQQGGYLKFLAALVEDLELKDALKRAESGEIEVSFNAYDWTLNGREQRGGSPAGRGGSAEFGSGSIPNQ